HKLSGRVVLADGKPVPAGTRVLLARQDAPDSVQGAADKDGQFSFAGLPPERYSLVVRVKGYHLSPRNVSSDGFSLRGVVREDISGLRLLLEPGPVSESQQSSGRRTEPLRGAPEG